VQPFLEAFARQTGCPVDIPFHDGAFQLADGPHGIGRIHTRSFRWDYAMLTQVLKK